MTTQITLEAHQIDTILNALRIASDRFGEMSAENDALGSQAPSSAAEITYQRLADDFLNQQGEAMALADLIARTGS